MSSVAQAIELAARLKLSLEAAFPGRALAVHQAITCLLAGGHLLIEDVPGVGKTLLATYFSQILHTEFRRIQFTSDLLPTDITGCVLPDAAGTWSFRPGPLFANVVLADELNRTSPRTQSAFLQAMEEKNVSIDGKTYPLPSFFWVIATQNPEEDLGTWGLPESQLDRFLMRIQLGFPPREQEMAILREGRRTLPLPKVATEEEVIAAQLALSQVQFAQQLEERLLDMVRMTRQNPAFVRGVSLRGAQAFHQAVRAFALVQGRDYVIPEDLLALAAPVLAHRVVMRDGRMAAVRAIHQALGSWNER